MTSLKSGVKLGLMKKLSLYIFLVLMWCNVGNALPKCEGDDYTQWINCQGTYLKKEIGPGWKRDFTGEFGSVPGKRHGKGSSKLYKDEIFDSTYVGEFKNDKPHGQGTESLATGEKYVGKWQDGERHGQGTCTWADGTKYEGKWKNHLRHGVGHMFFSNGSEYIGDFKNGKFEGEGTFIKEGIRTKGIWKNNKLVKQN
tara:strand:+ start:1029 stop:1622 length:594 start_codon:yes stop_codon:yes gene_type:complete